MKRKTISFIEMDKYDIFMTQHYNKFTKYIRNNNCNNDSDI